MHVPRTASVLDKYFGHFPSGKAEAWRGQASLQLCHRAEEQIQLLRLPNYPVGLAPSLCAGQTQKAFRKVIFAVVRRGCICA